MEKRRRRKRRTREGERGGSEREDALRHGEDELEDVLYSLSELRSETLEDETVYDPTRVSAGCSVEEQEKGSERTEGKPR